MSWALKVGKGMHEGSLGPKQKFLGVPTHSELSPALGKGRVPTRDKGCLLSSS